MKIAVINSYYDYGSTGKIEKEIVNYLIDNKDIPFVYYAWDTNFERNNEAHYFKYATIIEKYLTALLIRITGNRYGYSCFSTTKLINKLKEDKPDIVHVHCPNSFDLNLKKLLNYLKTNRIETVITEHAEFYHTGNCPHSFECEKWKTGCGNCQNLFFSTKSKILDRTKKNWLEMKNVFKNFDTCTVVSVSDWLKSRTEVSPLTKDLDIRRVHNGIDTDIFRHYKKQEVNQEISKRFTKKTILFVTSNLQNPLKGFAQFKEITKRMLSIDFILICKEKCDINNLPNVIHIDYLKNGKELAQYYSMADLSLLCSKRETFSMVVAESLSCGTPVVGFYAGGPESIAIKEYSMFSDYGDIDTIVDNINKMLNSKYDNQMISDIAKITYSSNKMVEEYYKIYKEKYKKA